MTRLSSPWISRRRGAGLEFETNVGDPLIAGPDNPIRVERDPETGEPSPYVLIRADLEALIDRKSFLSAGRDWPEQRT